MDCVHIKMLHPVFFASCSYITCKKDLLYSVNMKRNSAAESTQLPCRHVPMKMSKIKGSRDQDQELPLATAGMVKTVEHAKPDVHLAK